MFGLSRPLPGREKKHSRAALNKWAAHVNSNNGSGCLLAQAFGKTPAWAAWKIRQLLIRVFVGTMSGWIVRAWKKEQPPSGMAVCYEFDGGWRILKWFRIYFFDVYSLKSFYAFSIGLFYGRENYVHIFNFNVN